jgi:hypothetical protein
VGVPRDVRQRLAQHGEDLRNDVVGHRAVDRPDPDTSGVGRKPSASPAVSRTSPISVPRVRTLGARLERELDLVTTGQAVLVATTARQAHSRGIDTFDQVHRRATIDDWSVTGVVPR